MRKLKCALSFLIVAAMTRSTAEETWHLLIEPTFMHYEATWPIDRAERTVLVPARYVNGEILPLKSDDIVTLGATQDKILASAPKAASEVLATLTPRFIRDENKVIQCAVLESDSPLTASAVLAPDFASLFTITINRIVVSPCWPGDISGSTPTTNARSFHTSPRTPRRVRRR